MMSDGTVYRQQKDPWFLVMAVAFAVLAALSIGLSALYSNLELLVAGIVVAVIYATFIVPNNFYDRYELSKGSVHIRLYFTNIRIPYKVILAAGSVCSWSVIVKTMPTSLKMREISYREEGTKDTSPTPRPVGNGSWRS